MRRKMRHLWLGQLPSIPDSCRKSTLLHKNPFVFTSFGLNATDNPGREPEPGERPEGGVRHGMAGARSVRFIV